jgi:hypothetical protein
MTTPIPAEDLPRALALALGWTHEPDNGTGGARDKNGKFHVFGSHGWDNSFAPHESHDDAQICVEECFKRGLSWEYAKALAGLGHIGCLNGEGVIAVYCLKYSAEMKARAALAALTGK